MNCSDFVRTTVFGLDSGLYNELRDVLVDEYLPLYFAQKNDLTVDVFAEKLFDYFEKIELKTGNNFEKVVDKYFSDFDSVVRDRISKKPKPKKNNSITPVSRARKYYDKYRSLSMDKKECMQNLLDYTRIMLCLYTAIIKNGFNEIKDFDLSLRKLNLTRIIEGLRKEKEINLLGRKPRFNTEDPYSTDRSTFVLLVIMFYYMKSKEIVGEY